MTRRERQKITNWLARHEFVYFAMWVTALGFACAVALIANNRAPQVVPPGESDWDYNGLFDWAYAFKWWGIGVGATFLPPLLYGMNQLIVGGRDKVGLTYESRRDRERMRAQREKEQALELRKAEIRIETLERELEIAA